MVGQVNLSTSALPAGMTAAFGSDIDVLKGQRQLILFSSYSTPAGSTPITVMASDGTRTRSASLNLTVIAAADFNLAISPNDQAVKPGGSASYDVQVTFQNGTGPVNLAAENLPQGVSANFSPNALTGSGKSTLTLTAGPEIKTAIQSVDVVARDNSGTIRASVGFDIVPANFGIYVVDAPTVIQAGGTFPAQIGISGLFNGVPGNVSLSAKELPPGVSMSFNPSTVSGKGTSNVTITADSSTAPGDYQYVLDGVDASGENLLNMPLTVLEGTPGADIFLGVSYAQQNVTQGDLANFRVYVSGPGAADPTTTVTVSVDKPDVRASLQPVASQPGVYSLVIATDYPQTNSTMATATVTAANNHSSQSIQVQVTIGRKTGV